MKKILFLIMVLFVGINLVNADGNTLEDVANKMKETEFFKQLDNEEDPIVIKTAPDKLVITQTSKIDEELYKFDFADDIISWKFTGDKNNPEDVGFSSLGYAFMIVDIVYAVGMLNGYTEEELAYWMESDDDAKFKNLTLEENGIEMTSFDYRFEDENGTSSGTQMETFKIDINKFNVGEITIPEKIRPTLELLEVNDTTVKFMVSAEGVSEGEKCELHRSDVEFSAEEGYILFEGDCNSIMIDDSLEPGNTYYYRAAIADDFSFDEDGKSDVIKVITKEKGSDVPSSSQNKVDTSGNVTENPKTGVNIAVFLIVILMIFGFIGTVNYIKAYSDLK